MSGFEIAGAVLGGLSIISDCAEIYKVQFKSLEDWFEFGNSFMLFIDTIQEQMMRYEGSLRTLLQPLIPDTEVLDRVLKDPQDPLWLDDSSDLSLKLNERLGNQHGRFLRIVDRFEEVLKALRKLLQIEDGKIQVDWVTSGTSQPGLGKQNWQIISREFRRMRFCFDSKKHRKVKELAGYNDELAAILGNCSHMTPISEIKKISKSNPLSVFEANRQNGSKIHDALRRHIKCAAGICKSHQICLCIQADPNHKTEHLNFLFIFKTLDQGMLPTQYIRIESTARPENAHGIIATTPYVQIQTTETNGVTAEVHATRGADFRELELAAEKARGIKAPKSPSLFSKLKKGVAKKSVSFSLGSSSPTSPLLSPPSISSSNSHSRASSPSKSHSPSPSSKTPSKGSPNIHPTWSTASTAVQSTASNSVSTLRLNSTGSSSPTKPIHSQLQPPAQTQPGPTPPGSLMYDLCGVINICPNDGELGVVEDGDDRYFKLSKFTTRKQKVEFPPLTTFTELVSRHQTNTNFRIQKEERYKMAAHISSALLQAHSSPWLPMEWSREDVCFFTTHHGIYKNYPYLSRMFTGIGNGTTIVDDDPYATMSEDELEEVAGDTLVTLGIIIIELILGRNICTPKEPDTVSASVTKGKAKAQVPDLATSLLSSSACGQFRYALADHGIVLPKADAWVKRVAREAGPVLADVVKKCLHNGTLGPKPNFRDKRFRSAVFKNIIRPLAEATSMWPEVFD